jgi:hypothetical protein
LRTVFLASRSGIDADLRVACARLRRYKFLRLKQRGARCAESVVIGSRAANHLIERLRLKQLPPVRRRCRAEQDTLAEIARGRRILFRALCRRSFQ